MDNSAWLILVLYSTIKAVKCNVGYLGDTTPSNLDTTLPVSMYYGRQMQFKGLTQDQFMNTEP